MVLDNTLKKCKSELVIYIAIPYSILISKLQNEAMSQLPRGLAGGDEYLKIILKTTTKDKYGLSIVSNWHAVCYVSF